MNESLRRALLRARLSEEDVAAHLEVDPKTVRRWLEGRIPYPRHRWLLAAVLELDETDLWPEFGALRSRPPEVKAIYPHLKDVPREAWLRLFGQAQERIDILASTGLPLAMHPEVLATLANRAKAGVRERICLRDPDVCPPDPQESTDAPTEDIRDALARYSALRHYGEVEVRVYKKRITNSFYRADGACLIGTGVYSIAASCVPIVHLRHESGDDLFTTYLKSFESTWSKAYKS